MTTPWISAVRPIAEILSVSVFGGWLATIDVLSRDACKSLAAFTYWACLPALTFVSVARTGVTLALVQLAGNIFFSIGLGLLLGKALVQKFGVSAEKAPIVLSLLAFRNIGNLPLVLIPSACQTLFFRSLFETVEECAARGNSYISFNIATVAMVQFTIVHYLFSKEEDDDRTESTGWWRHWNGWKIKIQHVLPPPAMSALLGALVSLIPSVRELVTQSFLADGADILAQATVGCTIPLLGATLFNEFKGTTPVSHERFNTTFMAFLVVAQLIAAPWVCSLLFLAAQKAVDLAIGRTSDPLMLFVGMTASSTPPAIVLLSLAIMYGVSPRDVAQVLLVLYAVAVVVFPLNVAGYLRVLSAMAS